MRLNKFMASCGVASRRKCDEIIESGRVKINAKKVKKLGTQVDVKNDLVTVDDRAIRIRGDFEYYILYKPVGYVTTVSDPQHRKTVMELIPDSRKRLYPIGRLDYNTSGLLLVTNDGDLTQKLTHPSFELGKTYLATVEGEVTLADITKLKNGVDIGGFITSKAQVNLIRSNKNESKVKLTIHEGKNRQVRRMFLSIGKKVTALERIAVGKLTLSGLGVGECRPLFENEIEYLKEL